MYHYNIFILIYHNKGIIIKIALVKSCLLHRDFESARTAGENNIKIEVISMRNKEKDAREMGERRERILKEGLRLFAEKTIEKVPMIEVANAAGLGIATLYRYYLTKSDLVMGISTDVWTKYLDESHQRLEELKEKNLTAAQEYEYMLDAFIDLYRNHKDILRFNQFFNVYVQNGEIPDEQMKPYLDIVDMLKKQFHDVYARALEDGTLKTSYTEQCIFSNTMHIMLAAVTRYAVGLVYVMEDAPDPENELLLLKEMMMDKFTVK